VHRRLNDALLAAMLNQAFPSARQSIYETGLSAGLGEGRVCENLLNTRFHQAVQRETSSPPMILRRRFSGILAQVSLGRIVSRGLLQRADHRFRSLVRTVRVGSFPPIGMCPSLPYVTQPQTVTMSLLGFTDRTSMNDGDSDGRRPTSVLRKPTGSWDFTATRASSSELPTSPWVREQNSTGDVKDQQV